MLNFPQLELEGEAAKRLAIAARAADLGIWEWNLLTGAMVYSERAKEIFGFPPGKPVTYEQVRDATHPDDLPQTSAIAARALDPDLRGSEIFRYRILRADTGELRWVVAHGEALFETLDGETRATRFIGTIQDITAQTAAEEALRGSEARLRLAMEAARMAVWEVDLTTDTLTPSPELNLLCGFPADAKPGIEEFRSRYAPGEHERLRREAADAIARGESSLQSEFRQIWPDGSEHWLLLRAQLVGQAPNFTRAVGVIFDITERRRTENLLREIADNAPAMIWVSDRNDQLTFMSRSWTDFTGQPAEGALGRGWLEQVHPEDRAEVDRLSAENAEFDAPFSPEYRLRRQDGEWRWVLDTAAPRLDAEGNLTGHIGLVIDITDRRLAEERRMLLIHELNHRVKNTLASVQSIVTQSLRGVDLPEDRRAALDARLAALARAHDVLTRESWESASLRTIAREAFAPFEGEASDRISVKGPPLRVTPKAALTLFMVFHELATNAAKYGALSARGGRVELAWELDANGGDLLVAIEWREAGGPQPTGPGSRRGFGSRLIERAFTGELAGEVELSYPPEGFSARAVLPVDEVLARRLASD
ncbi:MAG TPA: PAS domain S-box protein [Mesorhizobium sp.]|jgi:PAS domain S-box-containing protein|nr:PAS domain S-box protein [Mesorhizobium sp.]